MAENIAQWLDGLGLGQYAQGFADNGIDIEALPHLRDEDFERLGVLLGHMRRLQAAIENLSADEPLNQSIPPLSQEPETKRAEAERRRLTVMFCDLVGSTELSQKLDPEDYRDLLTAFQDACSGAVKRHQGHVAKHLGDGLLAYFGYPQAHEDDAEQAARAGLAVVAAVSKLDDGTPLNVRVGIATGLAVVGDIVGDEMSEADAISGDTPNLAARLQAFAGANMVVIGERTYALLSRAFECEALGAQRLKGIKEPFEVWRVVGERRSVSRFETRHTGVFTSFVGRRDELDLLTRRWDQAVAGEGQVVLISGEAGIGKSRIAEMIHQRLPAEGHLRLLYQCSPHHTNSALYPVIEQLNLAAGFGANEVDETKLDKLENLISQATDDVSAIAPLFADLLSIRQNGRYPALDLTPQAQKERTLEALAAQLVGLAARSPVLFVFEDLHWADPTTRELLDLVVTAIEEARALALLTFRPEYEAPWVGPSGQAAMRGNGSSGRRRRGAAGGGTERHCNQNGRCAALYRRIDQDDGSGR
jgi:class 3 adenylate cyclase